jgi:hypothetical protein
MEFRWGRNAVSGHPRNFVDCRNRKGNGGDMKKKARARDLSRIKPPNQVAKACSAFSE